MAILFFQRQLLRSIQRHHYSVAASAGSGCYATFFAAAAGGYNGPMAKIYERGRSPRQILEIYRQMRGSKIPIAAGTYNYVIWALMKLKKMGEAYRVLTQMEEKGVNPDVTTFEILLSSFATSRGLFRTVDELFGLMQHRYGLTPTPKTWAKKVEAWVRFYSMPQAISYYEEMRSSCPQAKVSSSIHTRLLAIAVSRRCWSFVDHLMQYIKPINSKHPWSARLSATETVLLTAADYQQIYRRLTATRNLSTLHFIRYVANQTSEMQLAEQDYVRLLFYASRIGNAAADLADHAIRKLFSIYSAAQKPLPKAYIHAFIDSTERESIEDSGDSGPRSKPASTLTPAIIQTAGRLRQII